MKEFFARHSYLVIWILALIIIGSAAILIVQLNGITTGTLTHTSLTTGSIPSAPTSAGAAMPVAPPVVTLTIVKSARGNSLWVQWQNLPADTAVLEIFRGKNGASSTWSLWKTVTLFPNNLANGTASINLGSSLDEGYSFYVQAVSSNGSDDGGGDNDGSTSTVILWVSSSTTPIVSTSTPDDDIPPPPSSPSSTPSSTPPSPAPTPSSTPSAPSSSPSGPGGTPSSPSSTSSSSSPSAPGDPYYNPQVQITGYGTAPGSFWVEHVNQSIEIGWQNIPDGVTTITVSRTAATASSTPTGPWNTIITQQNPGTNGSYSLDIVDDTVNDPYYYEMTALEGTTTIATYGPVYLAPQ